MTQVRCLILAGGLGTRIRSALGDLPKCLAPVGSTSFITLLVAHLRRQGFPDIVLSLGHGSDQVARYVKVHDDLKEITLCREPLPLGTGGAILFAMDELGLEEAIVVNGDTLLDASADALWSELRQDLCEHIRLLGVEVPNVARFGALRFDAEGRLTGFQEKGVEGKGYINAGYYRVNRHVFGDRKPGEVFSFENEILTSAAREGSVRVVTVSGRFTDIGVPEDYLAFCAQHATV
ncbi:sugar phosphate nucleotidyltransferase [Aquabacterium sp.]|uniref:sugar phosphate nucleotidyltransferase n=1 Tax=Aquabacterium sp. TaxID=1872578 RepID=UPI003B6B79CC